MLDSRAGAHASLRLPFTQLPTAMPLTDSRQRARFLDHRGLRVVLLDFEGITDPPEGLAAVAAAKAFIAKLPADGSACTLTDVRNTRYNKEIVEAFKDLTVHNRPYVRAAAVISDSSLHRAAIAMISVFSRRKLGVFATREEGLAYLADQMRRD